MIGRLQSHSTPFGSVAPRLHVLSLRSLHPERDDFNEITAHALSAIHTFLRATSQPRQQDASMAGDEYKVQMSPQLGREEIVLTILCCFSSIACH